MRVALSVIAKFHHFTLGRELLRHGVLDRIYSGYPWFKLKNEGVPRHKVDCWPVPHSLRMGLARSGLLSARMKPGFDDWAQRSFEAHVARSLPEGLDIFHGLGRYSLKPGQRIQTMGGRFILDVGSSHIDNQIAVNSMEHRDLGLPFHGPKSRTVERLKQEYEAADLITVPSDFVLQTFLDHGVARDKLAKVPYGVDISKFAPQPVADDGVFRVVFIGGLTLRKGIRYLVDGFNRAAIPGSELILIGSQSAETDAALRGLALDGVTMTGHLPQAELPTWLSRATVFVLPSIEDGVGMVLLQALACGCPVIASTNTGGTEYIRDGENGFVVPIRDPQAIADRLTQLADDPVLAQSMRTQALATAQQAGNAATYGDRMVETYAALLAGRAAAA